MASKEIFLKRAATYITQQHSIAQLPHLCIVLPSRRGVYFFKKYLSQAVNNLFLSPKIVAIEDFISQLSGKQIAENIELYLELFLAAKSLDDSLKFEFFISWAPTILSDFDLIDQYLVPAEQLFGFMTEAKAMERWEIDHEKRKNNAQKFDGYYELYKKLYQTYRLFNTTLNNKGKTYRGAAYRYLAENVTTALVDQAQFEKYYFVGFNALSLAEETIIGALAKAGLAETLWQTDSYYMGDDAIGRQAGKFLKEYQMKFTQNNPWRWTDNTLLSDSKNISLVECSNASQQAMVAGHYLKQGENKNTALILADENLLTAVQGQIPENIKAINYTMGISFKNSALYQLLDALFALQINAQTDAKGQGIVYNNRLLIKLLQNKLIGQLLQSMGTQPEPIIETLKKSKLSYISQGRLALEAPALAEICGFWQHHSEKALLAIEQLLSQLRRGIGGNLAETEQLFMDELEKMLQKARQLLARHDYLQHIAALQSLLKELLKNTKIPYESDIESQLQVMGMLESRSLDFDRVILLSANENILPASKKAASLIPYDALISFGMPTYSQQDAIMAYHFYRLMQYPGEIICCYTSTKAGYGGQEKSRFLLQLEKLLAKQNTQIQINSLKFQLPEQPRQAPFDIQVEKTDEIIQGLKNWLQAKGLSATSLNTFLDCSMKFFLERIVKLQVVDELDEVMGTDIFGEVVHLALERLHGSLGDEAFDKNDILKLNKQVDVAIEQAFDSVNEIRNTQYSRHEGQNLILVEVAKTILHKYFAMESQAEDFPKKNIAIEDAFLVDFPLEKHQITVKLMGKCDRIEETDNSLKIIDYKTGIVNKSELVFSAKNDVGIEMRTEKLLKIGNGKMRQLWLYKYILGRQLAIWGHIETEKGKKISVNKPIQTGIYSFRSDKMEYMAGFDFFEQPDDFMPHSTLLLKQILEKMLDKSIPFERSTDQKICTYCDFKSICGR